MRKDINDANSGRRVKRFESSFGHIELITVSNNENASIQNKTVENIVYVKFSFE